MTEVKVQHDSVATYDLCDHWIMVGDHQCQSYWREQITLRHETRVGGRTMFGRYHSGVWRFCRLHAAIFRRDRLP